MVSCGLPAGKTLRGLIRCGRKGLRIVCSREMGKVFWFRVSIVSEVGDEFTAVGGVEVAIFWLFKQKGLFLLRLVVIVSVCPCRVYAMDEVI
jgi:hypothetical protein